MIGIVRPDSGNLTSICDALARMGQPHRLLPEPNLEGIERLILPGQGRFGAVMAYLNQRGWAPALRQWFAEKRPFLGICVGMQVLFESSAEDPGVAGLGLFTGQVRQLCAPKTPMIGWAQIDWIEDSQAAPTRELGLEMPQGAAYFVNRYVVPASQQAFARCENGESFVAAVRQGPFWACQFHPEKSGVWGKEFLHAWLTQTRDSLPGR